MISISKKEHIKHLLNNPKKFKKFKDLVDKKYDEYNSSKLNPFTKHYESCKAHDKLLHLCISAFTSEGKCFDKLDYCFYSSEPFLELGVKNFDIFVINQSTNYAIFIECKTSIRKGDVNDKYDAIKEIISNKKYLESKIGNKIHHIEYVFCIPSSGLNTLIKQLDNVEKNNKINPKKDPVFLIWHINRFAKKKTKKVLIKGYFRHKPGKKRGPASVPVKPYMLKIKTKKKK